MKINAFCLSCLVGMQESQIRQFTDEEKKVEFMREILGYLSDCDESLSAPALVRPLSLIYEKYWGKADSLEEIKREFNDFLLGMEESLDKEIRAHRDPLAAALCYARAGNYIDYASVRDLSKEKLVHLLEKETDSLDKEEYSLFCEEIAGAERLVYLTDNCGEIVLDKLVNRLLQEMYPKLHIQVIVRGAPVVNDADMDTARYIGLTDVASVMDNGSAIAGTDLADISPEALREIQAADIIISKGQGNFETLHGCGLNIYYLFLCKCDWFVQKFHARRLQGMFVNERRIES